MAACLERKIFVDKQMSDCDTSSSEDEATKEALREAADPHLLKDSFFAETKTAENPNDNLIETKPSLRCTEKPENFYNFGVSQFYKDYVAKKLDELLERSIEEVTVKRKKRKKRSNNKNTAGIRLLSSSKCSLSVEVENLMSVNKGPMICAPEESALERKLKCREAAVDPEMIIAKTEIKAWTERQKGTVYRYKRSSNGVLTEQ